MVLYVAHTPCSRFISLCSFFTHACSSFFRYALTPNYHLSFFPLSLRTSLSMYTSWIIIVVITLHCTLVIGVIPYARIE